MKIGFYYFATDYSMPVVEVARALEERGYESLFVPEHTHIPASRRTPWPGGAELPREYSHTLDPFVALAAAAAATRNLRLGTGICLLTERDPIVTAKEVATLDLISDGRFEFGIGAGWNVEEMANHGTGVRHALSGHGRSRQGDAGDLDPGRGGLRWRVHVVRADLVVAQAGAEAAPADPSGRRDQVHAAPGDGVLRRLVPARAGVRRSGEPR